MVSLSNHSDVAISIIVKSKARDCRLPTVVVMARNDS
jgi:hypothetical protein